MSALNLKRYVDSYREEIYETLKELVKILFENVEALNEKFTEAYCIMMIRVIKSAVYWSKRTKPFGNARAGGNHENRCYF